MVFTTTPTREKTMNKKLIYQQIAEFWNTGMPFNQLLGLEISKFDAEQSEISFLWQDKLIGNPVQKILSLNGYHYYNTDGSKVEMCGNGAICVAKYAFENLITKGPTTSVNGCKIKQTG